MLKRLFEKPPILVEVRFPTLGTSPDWYLCQDETALQEVFKKLGKGAVVYLSSVWDLKNTGACCMYTTVPAAGPPNYFEIEYEER